MGAATSMSTETSGAASPFQYPLATHQDMTACSRCGKRVYANEMLRTERRNERSVARCWHVQCFKCKDCGTRLRPDSWEEALNGDLVCKTHYAARKNAVEAGGVPPEVS